MDIIIRREVFSDYSEVASIVEEAFKNVLLSDHREHELVARLRKTEAFIPELSLVAIMDDIIVGHILLTSIKIGNETSLALAPVSVLPEYQGKGIGSKLIVEAHRCAKALGYKSIILLGHKDYYPRFGYVTAENFGIQLPFDVPSEYVMAIELTPNALKDVSGIVEYHPTFFE